MKFSNIKLIFLLFLSTFVFILNTNCYGEINKLKIVYTDWYPYTYQENGNASGLEIDIFKAIMNIMKIEAQFVKYPWKRCLHVLKIGEADALISLLRNSERESFTYFPDENISVSKTMFFTTTDKKIIFDGDYKNLKNYSIGVISGFSYGDVFDNATYLKKDKSKDVQMLIRKLIGGRNDIVAENQVVMSATSLKMGFYNKIEYINPSIHNKKLYVGFSKEQKHGNLCDEFSKHLHEFKKTDLYKSIIENYGIHISDMGE